MDTRARFLQLVSFIADVHQVTHEITADARVGELTPAQFGILEHIAVSGPATPSMIADCRHLSLPNASREIRKLCEKNLCEKYDAEDDRRKQYVRLSPEGQARMETYLAQAQARYQARIQGLSEEELRELDRAIALLQGKLFRTRRHSK